MPDKSGFSSFNVAASIITMSDAGSISSTFASIEAAAGQVPEVFLKDSEKLH